MKEASELMQGKEKALAVYIHWPFCRSKCPYCDFNSHVAAGAIDLGAWATAYVRELKYYAARLPGRRVTSIFFGGGTPSLMPPTLAGQVLDTIARLWTVDLDAEITLEANPNSAEAANFAGFRAAGVNRLSLGVQALRDEDLRFLGRAHDASEARRAIELAGNHFPRFSFDLIYARHGQTLSSWQTELKEALALAGHHLSLYQLTIEPHTQFHTRAERGELLTAPDDASVAMFEATQEILAGAGLPAYEISDHAKPGEESRHNLAYWHYDDYIGIGPGAHGRFHDGAARFASDTHRAPEVWLKQVNEKGQGLRVCEALDAPTAMREALMMGLRLSEGIAHNNWLEKFGTPLEGFLPTAKIARLTEEGLIANDAQAFKATQAGRQRLNAVLKYLAA